jgi:hypothetical protein
MTNPLKTMNIESDCREYELFSFKKKTKRTINLKSIRERKKKCIQRILKLHSRNHNNEWFLVLLYHHTGL